MQSDILRFTRNCQICRLNKYYVMPKIPILEQPEVSTVWQRLHFDLIGPLPVTDRGNTYILTAIDAFSRYTIGIPIVDKKQETVARAVVTHVFSVLGVPSCVYTDRGKEFLNHC